VPASAVALPDHVTPYDRFAWSDVQIEQCLAAGTQQAELAAYFGAAEQRMLSGLARRAVSARVRRPLKVVIVPGIMGSQLGLLRSAPLPNDIVWLDPLDIQLGRLAALRLPAPNPVAPLGVMLFSYLRLKLRLRAQGFAVELHDYDWRLPVATTAAQLAERLRAARAERVALVAHSMGGLVSRAALALPGTGHVERVVLLGTPHSGSFAAVQALRGTYAVVRKLARLVSHSSAEELAADIFNSFPSLYELLPRGRCAGPTPLFEADAWPRSGPRPQAELLDAARTLDAQLAPADERCSAVIGIGAETTTAVRRRGDDFVYTLSRLGDGTVPATSAELPGARSYYARVAHSELTRDAPVAAAVADLLLRGKTSRLPDRWRNASRARTEISDRALRRTHLAKVDWAALTPDARRVFLETLNEPPRLKLRVPARR
jgi:pimeloyl-ACP methyl ester carboxylesterase